MTSARGKQTGRRLGVVAGLLLAALTLTGCHLDVNQETLVKPDGSGTVTTSVLADKTTQDLATQNGVDLSEVLRQVVGDAPSNGSVKEVTEGDKFGLEVTAPFKDTEELGERVLGAGGNSVYDEFTLEKRGKGFTLNAHANTKNSPAADEFPSDELKESLDTRITITLPGDLKSTNADEKSESAEGNVLTWRIPGDGEKSLQAETGGGTSVWIFVLVGGALALVAGAIFLATQKVKVTPLSLLGLFQGLVASGVGKLLDKRGGGAKEVRAVDNSKEAQRTRIERTRTSMEAQRKAGEAAKEASAHDFPAPQVQAGWYADPQGQAAYRWFDGKTWTSHVRNG